MENKVGITLIGMPGVGKSTHGKILAARIGWKFLDLDDHIKETQGRSHDEIMVRQGEQALATLEQSLTLELDLKRTVFAPPGSIIFSKKSMEKSQAESFVVFLDAGIERLKRNLGKKINKNGILGLREKGIEGIFAERTPMYRASADVVLELKEMKKGEVADKLYNIVKEHFDEVS